MIFGGILTIDKHAVFVFGVMLSDGIDGGFDWKKVTTDNIVDDRYIVDLGAGNGGVYF
jgi:hypothetical protein